MFAQVFSVVAVMFILVFVGMLVRHVRIIDKGFTTSLSSLLVLVTFPVLIFYSTISQFTRAMILDALILIIFGISICFLGCAIGFVLSLCLNLKGTERNVFLILCAFGNTGFLAIPIGLALYGMDAVIRIILFDLGCSIVMWTFGIWLISSHKTGRLLSSSLKSILNPGMIAMILGLGVVMAGSKMPRVLAEVCNLLGGTTIPMALIATGSLVYVVGFHRQIRWGTLIAVTAGKLVVMPILVILILSIIDLSVPVRNIIVLEAAMPSMVLGTILAEKYNSDSSLAASGVFLTTLVSAITIPTFLSFPH